MIYTFSVKQPILLRFVCCLVLLNLLSACNDQKASSAQKDMSPLPAESAQMILVITEHADSTHGSLQRFEREKHGGWTPVSPALPCLVGRNGLAWGTGEHAPRNDRPAKKEGDGRSPAGIFRLSAAFGFAAETEIAALKMPYLQITDLLECVDDVASLFYNQIVDRSAVDSVDWTSSEKMAQIEVQYEYGITVEHNSDREASGGSCIFLHVWGGADSPTSGCTAVERADMLTILAWLNAAKNPLLVQLTRADYQALKKTWQLP